MPMTPAAGGTPRRGPRGPCMSQRVSRMKPFRSEFSDWKRLTRYTWVPLLGWTAVVATLLAVGLAERRHGLRTVAAVEARAHFDKDQAFRLWATSHGGVYVVRDERTPSNPRLAHVPERDVVTPSGRALTLMNPAYMIRQLHEQFDELFGSKGHITSLKPLRPENAADAWEQKALRAFARGVTEVTEFTEIDGEPYLRLMRPMPAQQDCLKCHTQQGYHVDDVVGGVSVSLPLAPHLASLRADCRVLAASYVLMWLLGSTGIALGSRSLHRWGRARQAAELELQETQANLEERVQRRTSRLSEAVEALEREIIARRRAEEALQTEREQLTSIFDGMDEVVYVCDPETYELLYTNGACRKHFGETEGRKCYRVLRGRDAPCPFCTNDRIFGEHEGQTLIWESWNERNQRWYRCVDRAIRWSDGRAVRFELALDITDSKRAADELNLRNTELAIKNAEMEQFAYTVSHDLKSPLVTIEGFARHLKQDIVRGRTDRLIDHLDRIQRATERMTQLIDELLDLSRIGRLLSETKPVALGELIERIRSEHEDQLSERGVTLTVQPDLPVIEGDEERIAQVFDNLLGNAFKYGCAGNDPVIEIGAEEVDSEVRVFVRDWGPGIAPEYHSRIFELFQRVATDKGGTGIGLAIVKRILEVHRGRVWIESEMGAGATFWVAFPKLGVAAEVGVYS